MNLVLRVFAIAIIVLAPARASFAASMYCYVALNTSPQVDFFSQLFTPANGIASSSYSSAFLQWVRENNPQLPWGDTSRGPFVLTSPCIGGRDIDPSVAQRTRDAQMSDNEKAGHKVIDSRWPSDR
jgi:hypothetical protein